jgi:hypothetical protein
MDQASLCRLMAVPDGGKSNPRDDLTQGWGQGLVFI